MIDKDGMKLFRKTDTTLVYIASNQLTKKIIGEESHCDLYIHVGRDKGNVKVYENNDATKIVHINMEVMQYILKNAAADR